LRLACLKERFSAAMGADETQIEASFCAAIRTAKEQKSISLEKRAEATHAEYRRQKKDSLRRPGVPTTSLGGGNLTMMFGQVQNILGEMKRSGYPFSLP
jgi:hypothetical protein